MKNYLNTLTKIIDTGKLYPDRTGTGRVRIFGAMETYNLQDGIPLVTTRRLYLKNMIKELLAFVAGHNQVEKLGETFWAKWAPTEADVEKDIASLLEEAKTLTNPAVQNFVKSEVNVTALKNHLMAMVGTIGPMYGKLWREFPRARKSGLEWLETVNDIPSDKISVFREKFMQEVFLSNGKLENSKENWENFAVEAYSQTLDQLNMVFLGLKRRPYSSRHRVTAFHPDLSASEEMSPQQNVFAGNGALAACHSFFQFMVTDSKTVENEKGEWCSNKILNCMFYMSSSDVALGRPYNIAQYALLTYMMAHCLDYTPGELTIVSCDTHLYADHLETAKEQIKRDPIPLAKLTLPKDKKDLFAFTPEDFIIEDYNFHEKLDYPASV